MLNAAAGYCSHSTSCEVHTVGLNDLAQFYTEGKGKEVSTEQNELRDR